MMDFPAPKERDLESRDRHEKANAASPKAEADAPSRLEEPYGTLERPHGTATHDVEDGRAPLFPGEDAEHLRTRWTEIQTNFVDEPRRAVEQADQLVAEVMERIATAFARNRDELERQWTAGDQVSTEDLRRTLRRYRGFFERLLSM